MEKEYIKKAIQGDERAINFIIDKYKGYAYSISFNICRNHQLAKDITQEAFINVFLSINQFKNEAKFSTWLFKIVYRETIKYLKKESNLKEIQIIDNKGPVYSELASDELERNQKKRYIKEALFRLPNNERIVLDLFYLHEKSIKEIIAITDISKANVKVLLHRGRKSLKPILEEYIKKEII